MPHKRVQEIQSVAIRFSGDSGDGMQLTGTKFTESTALAGNDLSTLPDFPAEIRAPAGTLAGVSGFQIHFSSIDVRTRALPASGRIEAPEPSPRAAQRTPLSEFPIDLVGSLLLRLRDDRKVGPGALSGATESART